MEYFDRYDSPIGQLLLISDGTALTGLRLCETIISTDRTELTIFAQAKDWLDSYFRGTPREIGFPLSPSGTAFQQQIWKLLLAIPFGQTRSYGALARDMAQHLGKEKMSAQAIGRAVGANPIWILIPCHRIVGAKGQLTGYAGGIKNKQWLLRHEEENT